MFRALRWLRLVVTLNLIFFNLAVRADFVHPRAALALVVALVAWTFVAVWAYSSAHRRTPLLLGLDLLIAAAAILVSPWLKEPGPHATVPGFWVMVVVLAWGVHWRSTGGLVAAAVVSAADLSTRVPDISQAHYGNVFLLMIGGPLFGYLCGSLQRVAAERDEAQRLAALAHERARLGRAVHDGVLQVLAMVQRRGAELGPAGAELGRLAGEQEQALRALVHVQETAEVPRRMGTLDVAALLTEVAQRGAPMVSVAAPGHPVFLPGAVATELVAAAAACLDNVAAHVGESAHAWVLLEDLGDRVVVSVRDEGPGIPDGRLSLAVADGRLGVSQSICGRLADIGGTAELSTGGHGTEWELSVSTDLPCK
jgi:signal transduction histidine kinase